MRGVGAADPREPPWSSLPEVPAPDGVAPEVGVDDRPWSSPVGSSLTPGGRWPPWSSWSSRPDVPVVAEDEVEVGELPGEVVLVPVGVPVTSWALVGTRTGTAPEKEALPASPTTAGTRAATRAAA